MGSFRTAMANGPENFDREYGQNAGHKIKNQPSQQRHRQHGEQVIGGMGSECTGDNWGFKRPIAIDDRHCQRSPHQRPLQCPLRHGQSQHGPMPAIRILNLGRIERGGFGGLHKGVGVIQGFAGGKCQAKSFSVRFRFIQTETRASTIAGDKRLEPAKVMELVSRLGRAVGKGQGQIGLHGDA